MVLNVICSVSTSKHISLYTLREKKTMLDIQKILTEYVDASYDLIKWMDDKKTVQLVRSRIDGCEYICKVKKHYDIKIYETLKEQKLDCIPKIYELIETEYGLVIIEEYISGKNLENVDFNELASMKGITVEDAIMEIGIKICRVLKEIHSLMPPIIHRDIKPQNIILLDENIYIIDFNIAKRYSGDKSQDTFIMGTRDFAAPEQYGFSESDVRTDVYGLGSTLRYLLNREGIESSKMSDVLKKATHIDPERRYQNVDEMCNALLKGSDNSVASIFKKYLFPGFRRGNIFICLLAASFYLVWGVLCLTMKMSPNPYDGSMATLYNWYGRIFLLVISGFYIFFSFDYLGIRSRVFRVFNLTDLPKKKKIIAIIGVDLLFTVFFFLVYLVASVFTFDMI